MINPLHIGAREVGPGHPVYIVAEMSANHLQDYSLAEQVVHAAKDAGVDAIKLQTYTADTLTLKSEQACFRVGGGTIWDGEMLHALYERAYMPWEWQPRLQKLATGLGLDFFSTAIDPTSLAFVEKMGVPVHKVTSFEIVDIGLIEAMARTGKPMIISTGMASLQEIEKAVAAALSHGAAGVALLKCSTSYPAPPEEMNLRTIPDLMQRFNVPVGLSDHTLGTEVPVAAVALGACIVEKHLTLSRSAPGPDNAFSLEPHEFKQLVTAVRTIESALGAARYGATEHEQKSLAFRRSLFVVEAVKQGEVFTANNVRSIRPADGLSPEHLPAVLGKHATRDLVRGTALDWNMVAKD